MMTNKIAFLVSNPVLRSENKKASILEAQALLFVSFLTRKSPLELGAKVKKETEKSDI
ncbi:MULTISPECIES: hypothetical protein [Proteus]|uniref:hypothetical protein n=1 Tax=Proteus sp. TJ1640 TaxID=2050968 RepID=UPI000197D970|nr:MULTISPECIES: hypothetical protein [Proteus]EEG83543.1 hypothetical protein PROPEN_04312 [Proteus penneri ATCC 35198]MCO8050434.1 hypothetical protein [Proteus penneri]MCX2586936.1 hypothetical protein [Proteus penneri]